MAFDPKAFLADVDEEKPKQQAAFDPKAFLSDAPVPPKPPKAAPTPDPELDEAGQVVPSGPGILERTKQSFGRLAQTAGSAAGSFIDLASPVGRDPDGGIKLQVPFGRLADGLSLDPFDHGMKPEGAYRRELLRGTSDVVTAGTAERLANRLDPKFAGIGAPDVAAAPGARELGNVAGMALPSPFRFAGSQAAKLVPGAGLGSAVGRNLATYEAASVPQAAVAGALNAPEGRRMEGALEAAQDAATDPAGLALSVAPPLVARGIQKAAPGAMDRKVMKALADIEEGGGKKAKAGIRAKSDEAFEVLKQNPDVLDNVTAYSTPKTDAKLRTAAEAVGKRGGVRLDEIYETADAQSARPAKAAPKPPREIELTDSDILESEAVRRGLSPLVPQPASSAAAASRAAAERAFLGDTVAKPTGGGGFDEITNAGHATVGGQTVAGPGRARVATQGSSAQASAAVGESESLLASAKAAEAEAAKLMVRAERAGRQAEGFVNKELSEKAARRASGYEIRADEARQRAEGLRQQGEAIRVRDSMPDEAPPPAGPVAPEAPPAPAPKPEPPPKPGVRVDDAAENMNREIKRLNGGDSAERATAKALESIRAEFQAAHGEGAIIPAKRLRAEQSAYQKAGYGKGMPGDEAATARIAANEIASRAVGDVVVKHVTGMDFATARAAAKADPKSLAGRLMRANDDVTVANRIEALVDSRKGSNRGAPHRLTALIGGLKHSAATAAIATTLGPTAAKVYAAGVAGVKGFQAARKGADAAALKLAPRVGNLAQGAGATNTAVARLVQASRAGATRAQLRLQAKQDGVPEETADRIAASAAP